MTSSDVNIIFEEEPVEITLNEDPVEIEIPAGQNGQSLRPRGAWSSSESYGYLDLVSYQGSSYVATKTVPVGTLPTDTGFWMLSAEKGLDGASEWGDITGDIANQTDLAQALAGKANVGDSYTKAETDTLLADKADADDVYSKSETDRLLSDKADAADVYTKTEADALLLDKAPVILNSASGSIASFTDGAPLPVENLSVAIEPVQDLHGYDNPWPAGGGANQWDEVWELGGINSSTGENETSAYLIRSTNYIPCSPATSYYFCCSGWGVNTNVRTRFYDSNKNYIGYKQKSGSDVTKNNSFVTPDDCYFMRFCTPESYGTTYNHNISINYPSTVTIYSPYSNICPISGWSSATVTRTGINIWDEEWELGKYNDNTGAPSSSTENIRSKNFIPVVHGTSYYIKAPNNIVKLGYDINKNFIGTISPDAVNYIFITPENCAFIKIYAYKAYGTTYNNDISINYPATDTQYHAYQGASVTISLDGTRYGGMIDVITGTMTVDRAFIEDASKSNWELSNYTHVFRLTMNPVAAYNYEGITSWFPESNNKPSGLENLKWTKNGGNYRSIYIRDDRYTTVADFKAGISGLQICYELATPVTVQLTPAQLSTLLGENHVWADTGDVAVTYRADTKLFIEGQIAQNETLTRKMIADSATADGKAPKSIATGDLIIVGDELRKATANIGNGSAITASNSTTATLADVIKALQ